MNYTLKKAIYGLLSYSGFYRIWRSFFKGNIVIFMLHGVMDEKEPASDWVPTRPQISRWQLEESIRLIAKYYEFISLQEAMEMLSGSKPFRNNCVVLSFDDGYRNNLTHAWPILKKYNVPAIIFPSVGHVDRREPFWYDRIDYALQFAAAAGLDDCLIGNVKVTVDASNRQKLTRSIRRVVLAAKAIPGDDFEVMKVVSDSIDRIEMKAKRRLKDIVETDYWAGVMSWDELRQAAREGISIGSHTIDHARLGMLSAEDAKHQMCESKRILEQQLGASCDFLCYPDGNYNSLVVGLANECGYRAALTTREGVNRLGDDVMQLKRFHLPQGRSAVESLAVASGLVYRFNKMKRRMRGK